MEEDIRKAIEEAYSTIGRKGSRPPDRMDFATGAGFARELGYPGGLLDRLSADALDGFVGAAPLPAEVLAGYRGGLVVDCGAGAGVDALWLASEGASVVALEANRDMMARLKRALTSAGGEAVRRVGAVRARLPQMPLATDSAEWVLMNGFANLIPDKGGLASEGARVLAPGGKLLIADVIALETVDEAIRSDPDAWAWCVGGALTADQWIKVLGEAGFAGVEVEVIERFAPLARGVVRAHRA